LTPELRPNAGASDAVLRDIESLVLAESPSDDLEALDHAASVITSLGTRLLQAQPERIPQDGRTSLRWRFGSTGTGLLVLGHYDTVWPLGSLRRHPFAVADGVLRGPGCLDMKSGIAIALHGVAALADKAGITILFTADEETGSESSRTLIEAEATSAAAVLVLEAATDDGSLKTERKGVSRYEVTAEGRAAHSGLEPERGINATIEAAHQILAVGALRDEQAGTTVTPTIVSGGTSVNTVPAQARFEVDVRAWTRSEQVRVDQGMRSLRPQVPGSTLAVHGGPNRAPMESPATEALFTRAQEVAATLGHPAPRSARVGGGSDGNLTAGLGRPTLDGLGATGGGAHSEHEHVRIDELPRQIEFLTALLHDLRLRPLPAVDSTPPLDGARP
jgi:glutamate carboxypeptidase